MNSQAAAVFCGSLFHVSIVLVRIVSLCPRTGAYIHRPCIWPHWNFTSPWISPRCLPLLRRLTALLPLLAPQWGHKYPSLPCHRLRRSCAATPENCKSKSVSLFHRSSRGLSADSRQQRERSEYTDIQFSRYRPVLAERKTDEENYIFTYKLTKTQKFNPLWKDFLKYFSIGHVPSI